MNQHLATMVEPYLPLPIWETAADLDYWVLLHLEKTIEDDPLTGKELGRLCGTGDRTIRASIKRLREAGHNITASLAPPRGYRLEE